MAQSPRKRLRPRATGASATRPSRPTGLKRGTKRNAKKKKKNMAPTTVGTTDFEAELPILQEIHDTERELLAVRDRERNQLRERGVFFDELDWPATPEMERLRQRLYELEDRAPDSQ